MLPFVEWTKNFLDKTSWINSLVVVLPLLPVIPIIGISNYQFEISKNKNLIEITSEACSVGKTGVEMEALTAVSVAALTIYDMCKSLDKEITITDIKLKHKSGGKSGIFNA